MASILPFVTVLTNPSLIETDVILNTIFKGSNIFGVKNNQQFLFALGVIVFVLFISSLIFKTFTIYVQVRFIQMREYSIGKRLIERYLRQPYSWFLNRHSAVLGKTILSEVNQVFEVFTPSRSELDLQLGSTQLDNLIRGERGGHPRLIYYSKIALLKWIFLKNH